MLSAVGWVFLQGTRECRYPFQSLFSALSGVYPEAEVLRHRESLSLEEPPLPFSVAAAPVHVPASRTRVPGSPHPCQDLLVSDVLDNRGLDGCGVGSRRGFHLHFFSGQGHKALAAFTRGML